MRFGMSWPAGRGRRQWISVGPAGALVLSVWWVAAWAVWAVVMVLYGIGAGGWWLFTRAVDRWDPRSRHERDAAGARP